MPTAITKSNWHLLRGHADDELRVREADDGVALAEGDLAFPFEY